ncbi:MAG: glycosyltransferase family 2 protein [Candidatus Promineifilaceae bacterium]
MALLESEAVREAAGARPAEPVDLSLVIPVFNEVENLRPLVEETMAALDGRGWRYELLFVDDGSSDGSFAELGRLHAEFPCLGTIRFRRNFGQTAAFSAGFAHARGDVIVTLDADRQNDPADIPALLGKLDEGYDVVNGWRQKRRDGFLLRRAPSLVANRLIARLSGVPLHDRGCSLRAYRSGVAAELQLYGELHRLIPELVSYSGYSMAEVAVGHRPRLAGRSKYGLTRTFRVLLDLVTIVFLRRYGARPMHLFGGLGFLSGGLGMLLGLYLAGTKVWAGIQGGPEAFRQARIGDRPLLTLAVLLVILGVQFVVMGLLAELIVRTYYESQGKPVYHIGEIVQPA